jgi:ElaB/YqjD/DUF883 family membrane-anchored ribosome-binding protein
MRFKHRSEDKMIDRQALEDHWNELVRYLKQRWSEVGEKELQQTRGDVQQLLTLLQSKTGWTRERIEADLDQWINRGKTLAEQAVDAARGLAQNAAGRARRGYEESEHMIQERPMGSALVVLGVGVLAGLLLSVALRSR